MPERALSDFIHFPSHSTGARHTMKKSLLTAAIVAGFSLPVAAQQVTVVNFGGANANAQKKAYYEPFEKSGTKVVAVEYNGEHARIGAKSDFLPAAVTECGIGVFVWSTVMAYNGDKLKDGPKTWADFFDTKKFAGKRGMRKGARYNV